MPVPAVDEVRCHADVEDFIHQPGNNGSVAPILIRFECFGEKRDDLVLSFGCSVSNRKMAI